MNAASHRLLNFNEEFTPPPKFIFEINPGNKEITKGDGLEISVKIKGSKPKSVYLASRKEEEAEFQKQQLIPDSSGNYFLEMNSVKSSFKYFAEADGFNSESYEIMVIDRPIVKNLDVEIISPSYSNIPKICSER